MALESNRSKLTIKTKSFEAQRFAAVLENRAKENELATVEERIKSDRLELRTSKAGMRLRPFLCFFAFVLSRVVPVLWSMHTIIHTSISMHAHVTHTCTHMHINAHACSAGRLLAAHRAR